MTERFHDHWLPLSDEDEEGVWRHYETGEVRSCSLSLSSSLSLSLSFLRPSENLKPHQRWQRLQIGVLDNQTGERSRTALVSESSTATGWTLILPPISYFTISNENQLFSINLIIIQDGTTAAVPRILGRVFARDSQASPSSGYWVVLILLRPLYLKHCKH